MKNRYVLPFILSLVLLNLIVFNRAMAIQPTQLICNDVAPIFSKFRKIHYKSQSLNQKEIIDHAQTYIKNRAFYKELNDEEHRVAAAPFLTELTRILSGHNLNLKSDPQASTSLCEQFQRHIATIKGTHHPLSEVSADRILQQYLSYFFLSIDPFSNFVSSDNTLADLQPYSSGYSKGIGITVDKLVEEEDYQLMVSHIVKNGPADKVHIKRGDVLLKINNFDLLDCDWSCYINIMDLPENANQFSVTVRQSDNTTLSAQVIRQRMSPREYNLTSESPLTVQTYHGPSKVGYISLNSFYSGSGLDLNRRLKALEKTTDALVLDLQRNTGGNNKDMLEVISSFTNQGGVVGRSVSMDGNYIELIAPAEMAATYTKPLVILVSNRTKSAGEFTAGVLQSLNRAVVIGLNGDQQTYGKGSTFTWFLVYKNADGRIKYTDVNHYEESSLLGALYVTSKLSYLTTGKSTHYAGIKPDMVFPQTWNDPVFKENMLWVHHIESKNENSMGPQAENSPFDSPGNNYDPYLKEKIKHLAMPEEINEFASEHLEQQIAFSKIIAARLTSQYVSHLAAVDSDPGKYSGAM